MRLKKLLLMGYLSLFLMAFTCYTEEDIENLILIENNLSTDIYCVPSFIYPDTSLVFTNKDVIKASEVSYLVKKRQSERNGWISVCYASEFDRVVENDTLILFVFNKDIVDQNTWEYITENDKVLDRIYLSYPDLKEQNCIVEIN